MTQQSTLHKISPFKGLSACFLPSFLSLSVLAVFFLSSPTLFSPFPEHAQNAVITEPQTDECNLFEGNWVRDLRGPLYTSNSCLTIPDSYNCFKHGGKDSDFLYWRWKPNECDLPRFDPSAFLKMVRGKKLAFVGDSLARNHVEFLLCLLSQAETPVDVYKDTEGRFRTWNFPSSNFTIMVMWTQFLVKHEERLINGSNSGTYDLHIDQINDAWASNLTTLDYVVLSVGQWLFRKTYLYNQTEIIGCVFCDKPGIRDFGAEDALRMVFRAALSYIDNCEQCGDVLTVLRSFSPAHFENGAWNAGGYCNRTRPVGKGSNERFEMEFMRMEFEEVERVKMEGRGKGKRFVGLDVSGAMLVRPDGHPGSHWPERMWKELSHNDCIHWCMPGPVDAWSDLLMVVLQRDQVNRSSLSGH